MSDHVIGRWADEEPPAKAPSAGKPPKAKRKSGKPRSVAESFVEELPPGGDALQTLLQVPGLADAFMDLLGQSGVTPPPGLQAYADAGFAAKPENLIAALEATMEHERRALGKDFTRLRGRFGTVPKTRPYMEARFALAIELVQDSRLQEAGFHLAEMLDLNPVDHQRASDWLLGVWAELGEWDAVKQLLDCYGDEHDAVNAWGRLLHALGTGQPAEERLAAARAANPHVEKYLRGEDTPVVSLAGGLVPGSREEAEYVAGCMMYAWDEHPAAGDWLRAQAPTKTLRKPASKRKPRA